MNRSMSTTPDLESVREAHPIVLFDGVCNLCDGFVQFLIERDEDAVLRFAPLQSAVGEALLAEFDLPTDALESVVLVEGEECYTKSDAALRTAAHLGGRYRAAAALRALPRFVRDWGYGVVAEHRYRLFGQKDSCMLPSPDVQARFLVDPTDGE
jgi:predicted DCC family thiol-disulfide oxidoreductase YuxK